MSRRRLTNQQQRRIDARWDVTGNSHGVDSRAGLVVASYGRQVIVEGEQNERVQCHMRAHVDTLVAGDRVHWHPIGGEGIITGLEPRQNSLERPDARGKLRVIAANIDLMLIVIAPKPKPHRNLIDRYLVAASHADIPTAVVLNKCDMLDAKHPRPTLIDDYEKLGYAIAITGKDDPESSALEPLIHDKTLVLVGQSGVGKSSIAQRLLPDESIRVGGLSGGDGKGRHTTTTAELFHLQSGGRLIDSPGIRDFHLHHLDAETVARGFVEFSPYIGQCKFRNCRHRDEAGCAVIKAAEDELISTHRLASYHSIIDAPGAR